MLVSSFISFLISTIATSQTTSSTSGLLLFEKRRAEWVQFDPQNNSIHQLFLHFEPSQYNELYTYLIEDEAPIKHDYHLGLKLVIRVLQDAWTKEGLFDDEESETYETVIESVIEDNEALLTLGEIEKDEF